MDSVYEVLNKPPKDRTDEDIGEYSTCTSLNIQSVCMPTV